MANIHVKLREIWTSGSAGDISNLELWWPLYSADQTHLCNFGRIYHEERFCKIILNLDQWFMR